MSSFIPISESVYRPSYAFDNILTTYYAGRNIAEAASDWIQVGFPQPQKVVGVSITKPHLNIYDGKQYDFKVFKGRHF